MFPPFSKSLDQLDEADLQALVDAGVREGLSVEYKSAPPLSDAAKNRLVRTVAAFANARGGSILYGIQEEKGLPVAIIGLADLDLDQLKLQIQQLLHTNIDPPVPVTVLQEVKTSHGSVLVVSVRRSWLRPHLCTNPQRFVVRWDAGNREMDRAEIRGAFLGAEEHARDLARFRDERAALAVSGQGPFRTPTDRPTLLLHFVPHDFADPAQQAEHGALASLAQKHLWGAYNFGQWSRLNFDGVISSQGEWKQEREGKKYADQEVHMGYSQLFRSRVLEFMTTYPFSHTTEHGYEHYIPSQHLEEQLIDLARRALALLKELGVEPPIYATLGLYGVRGYTMAVSRRVWFDVGRAGRIDRDDLVIPAAVLLDHGQSAIELLHEPLNAIWRASGWPRSRNISADHQWRPES